MCIRDSTQTEMEEKIRQLEIELAAAKAANDEKDRELTAIMFANEEKDRELATAKAESDEKDRDLQRANEQIAQLTADSESYLEEVKSKTLSCEELQRRMDEQEMRFELEKLQALDRLRNELTRTEE